MKKILKRIGFLLIIFWLIGAVYRLLFEKPSAGMQSNGLAMLFNFSSRSMPTVCVWLWCLINGPVHPRLPGIDWQLYIIDQGEVL